MYNSLSIANYFISIGIQENQPITQMKLQKLIYFAHGFYLAVKEKPLIRDEIQAWKYGPVIPQIYHRFKHYGNKPLLAQVQVLPSLGGEKEKIHLDKEIIDFLFHVWELFRKFDAIQISTLTHVGNSPWSQTVKSTGGLLRNSKIDNNIIKSYFLKEYIS